DLLRLPARPFHDLDRHATPLGRLQDKLGYGGPMAGNLAVEAGPLATAKEQETLLASAHVNGQVEKVVRRRRVGDLDVRAGAGLDELVAERLHPAVAVLAQQLLEGVPLEALGPDGSPDTNVHE